MKIEQYEPFQVNLFRNILKDIKTKKPMMIELGCGEAEYSKIFNDYFSGNCKNICIDILPRQLEEAKLNCPSATFIHGYVGEPVHTQEIRENTYGATRVFLNDLICEDKLNILHMDIQGSEVYVMEELYETDLLNNRIDYMFISLHNTYDEVKRFIPLTYEYLYENPFEGGLGDGLIVVKNKDFK